MICLRNCLYQAMAKLRSALKTVCPNLKRVVRSFCSNGSKRRVWSAGGPDWLVVSSLGVCIVNLLVPPGASVLAGSMQLTSPTRWAFSACKAAQTYSHVCPLSGSQDTALRPHCFLIVPALSLHPLPSLIVWTCLLEFREGPGG